MPAAGPGASLRLTEWEVTGALGPPARRGVTSESKHSVGTQASHYFMFIT